MRLAGAFRSYNAIISKGKGELKAYLLTYQDYSKSGKDFS